MRSVADPPPGARPARRPAALHAGLPPGRGVSWSSALARCCRGVRAADGTTLPLVTAAARRLTLRASTASGGWPSAARSAVVRPDADDRRRVPGLGCLRHRRPVSPVRYLIVLGTCRRRAAGVLPHRHEAGDVAVAAGAVAYHAQQAGDLRRRPTTVVAAAATPMQHGRCIVVVLGRGHRRPSRFSAVNERELRRRRYDLEALAELAARLEQRVRRARRRASALLDARRRRLRLRAALLCSARPTATALPLVHAAGRRTCPARRRRDRGPGRSPARSRRAATRSCSSKLDPDADAWLAALLPDARNLSSCRCRPRASAVGVARRRARAARPARASSAGSSPCSSASPPTARWRCATPGCSSRSSDSPPTDALTGIANRAHLRRRARARARPRRAATDGDRSRCVHARPRPLQAAQRHPRPPGRRRGAAPIARDAATSSAAPSTSPPATAARSSPSILPGSAAGRGPDRRRAAARRRRAAERWRRRSRSASASPRSRQRRDADADLRGRRRAVRLQARRPRPRHRRERRV